MIGFWNLLTSTYQHFCEVFSWFNWLTTWKSIRNVRLKLTHFGHFQIPEMSKRFLKSTQGTLAHKPEKHLWGNNSEKQKYFSRWEKNPRQIFWVRPTESGFKQKVWKSCLPCSKPRVELHQAAKVKDKEWTMTCPLIWIIHSFRSVWPYTLL
jgi:hypothetical protein